MHKIITHGATIGLTSVPLTTFLELVLRDPPRWSIPTPTINIAAPSYTKMSAIPQTVQDAVLVKSNFVAADQKEVKGFDFSEGSSLDALAASMLTTGFQATNVGLAINEINRMVLLPCSFIQCDRTLQ